MPENGLEIKISPDDYSKKTIDEKLDILYQVSLTQQQFCSGKTGEYDERIVKFETEKKVGKAKLIGIGIGSGGGAGALFSVIKSWLSGGG